MQRFFLSILLVLAIFACGPLPQEQEAESAVGITAPDGFSISCVSQFTRSVPHFCKKNSTSSVSVTLDNTCRAIDHSATWGVPTTAKYVQGSFLSILVSNTLVTERRIQFVVYNESTCTTIHDTVDVGVREFVALAPTVIHRSYSSLIVPLSNNGNLYYKANNVDGASHSGLWQLTGYYD